MAATLSDGGVALARQLGRDHKPEPDAIRRHPTLHKAYLDGSGTNPPVDKSTRRDTPPAEKTPSAHRPRRVSRRATSSRHGGLTSHHSRAGHAPTVRRRTRDLARHPATLGTSTGGGLLLALFAYPVVVAALKYGAAGPGTWLKAKFLNKTPAATPGKKATAKKGGNP